MLTTPSSRRSNPFRPALGLATTLAFLARAASAAEAQDAAPDASAGTAAAAQSGVSSARDAAAPPNVDVGGASDAGAPVVPEDTPNATIASDAGLDAASEPSVDPDGAAAARLETPDDPEAQLGTVVVTAQRRTDTLQHTPIAITAFDKDAVQQQKISTFRDLAGRTPGLLVPLRSTAYTTQTYSLRGIGETDTYPEPSVAVYIDDVYLARSVGSIYDTPDLERVEVLRGPQGTLYGRNSSSGAIRFITKTPTAELESGLSVRLGTLNDQDVRGRISGPVLPDDLLNASISLIRHRRDGYTFSVPLDRYVNDINIWALRAKTKSIFSERFSLTLSGDSMFDRSTQSYYTPINQPNGVSSGDKTDPDRTWSNTQPLNKTTVYGGSATLQYDIDDHLVLKSVTAVRGMHGPIYYDNDGVTYIKGDSYAGFNQNYETEELTLNGEFERVNFVGGVYYFNEYFHNNRLNQAAGSPINDVGVITHTNSRLYTQSIAGFGQVNIAITHALTGTLGARYTADTRRFENLGRQESMLPLTYPLPGNFDPNRFDSLFSANAQAFVAHTPWKTFAAFTPKVGAQYQFTPDLLAYANFAQGFKSGGFDLRATSLNASVTGYRPQITSAFELGWKSAVLDHRVTLNLAAFYNKIKDVQVRATSPGSLGNPVNLLINAGNAHTYGGEAELAAQPVRSLRLGASLAYLQTAYETFTATLPPNVAGRTTLLGLDFPLAPTWQANLNFSYRIPIPTPGVWRIGGDIPFESKRYIDIYDTPQIAIRAQLFVNGTINYTSENQIWSAGVSVNNLFDLRRQQSGNYAPTNAGTEPLYYAAYNPPRLVLFFLNIGNI